MQVWFANMARIRQSRPDSGLGFQVKILEGLKVFPFRSAAAPELGLERGEVEEVSHADAGAVRLR